MSVVFPLLFATFFLLPAWTLVQHLRRAVRTRTVQASWLAGEWFFDWPKGKAPTPKVFELAAEPTLFWVSVSVKSLVIMLFTALGLGSLALAVLGMR